MTDKHPFIQFCKRHLACVAGVSYVKRFKSPQNWWAHGKRSNYMGWLIVVITEPIKEGRYIENREGLTQLHSLFHSFDPLWKHDEGDARAARKAFPRIPWKQGMK